MGMELSTLKLTLSRQRNKIFLNYQSKMYYFFGFEKDYFVNTI
ncbi:hypothetical protein ATK78_2210 [Pedobacter metabolipauper]|uniref:Uncharacterized protein n=1 Tax=Pedobacter metabolipauper TaxID=425513 RepID=A0A4R6SX67_9SPHI|nr:hypothetical protein ATK78_2210 [Pedobacter metabolipauper]